ncbi:uncharacterized protein LOC130825435 [Amaranthus tricolor]|uniref:uncharacterized protein LOC130825435 n=1 Tax=Amaranthus tricolor TaxID=29722 RepID=UPI00258FA280|nr:uncharacterized protein LOC130825435 [Amaranthus tricolor]XP_057546648.1 uncharacterized protein LOC130825435 [Amaranthus tricolor]
MENLEGSAESSGRESAAPVPPPFYIPNGGPLNYFIDLQTKRDLDNRREAISQKWGLKDNINIITPGNYDTVRFPPPHCIAVYFPSFELGLRFPLHPFFREVLEFLNISVPELYPNAWGCMVAFLILCKVLAVPPTLTAFRYIFRALLCNSQSYGCGWTTFTHRRGLKIVQDLPDNQKGYRTKFAYLYNSEGWNIKTSFDIKPNLSGFNNGIPQCSFSDAVIIEYAKMDIQLGRKPMNIQLNWIPDRPELENENLLSAFGISLAIDRRIAKENLRAKSPELMKKFSVLTLAQGAIQRPEDKPLPLPPKSDLNEVTIDEHLEAIEEAALKELILNTCGNFLVGCKELPGQLYDSLIEGLTTLVYLLYDKEDLYRMGSSRMVIDQQNKFWEELAPIGEKVDQYTDLLIEMFTDRDMKCQEFLIAKAVEIIDIETLYSLDAHSLSFIIQWPNSKRSPHEEFDSLLKFHLFNFTQWRKEMVKNNVNGVLFPFSYLLMNWDNMLPLRGNFDDFIEVAELRRKAEGTRFINRDHFMWAFRERGYELPSMFMDIAASRNADDKSDQPLYHIYFTTIALSKAGQEPLQFEHLAFAVVFSNSFGFSNEEEVEKMKVDFKAFKTALSNHGVSVPKGRSGFKTKSYFYDEHTKTIRWFKGKLKEGLFDELAF